MQTTKPKTKLKNLSKNGLRRKQKAGKSGQKIKIRDKKRENSFGRKGYQT